ncbi:MAG: HNH endonuclease [marine bacterium B5-7]|nr:MAG: HNH endonuclease [marine bacterium B5-7]
MSQQKTSNSSRLDQVVADAHRARDERERGYRERALKMYPWICGRCSREFDHSNLRELTVHHRDHDHDNNPEDGSNWELLCVYCHDNEHARYVDAHSSSPQQTSSKTSTHRPLAGLADLLKKSK